MLIRFMILEDGERVGGWLAVLIYKNDIQLSVFAMKFLIDVSFSHTCRLNDMIVLVSGNDG